MTNIIRIARDGWSFNIAIVAAGRPARAATQAVLLDSRPIRERGDHPPDPANSLAPTGSTRWGNSNIVEVRIKLDNKVLRSSPSAARPMPPTPISSCSGWWAPRCARLVIAILFLRGQIRPILKLTQAAESFGKRDSDARRASAPPRRRGPAAAASPSSTMQRTAIERAESNQRTGHGFGLQPRPAHHPHPLPAAAGSWS